MGLATTAFGTAPVVATMIAVPAAAVVGLRFLFGAPLMLLVVLAGRRRLTPADLRHSALGGLLLPIHVLLFYMAARRTSVADVTFIMSLQPVLIFAAAPRLLGERVSSELAALGALGIVGVGLVVYGSSRSGLAHPLGEALAVANLLVWTSYLLASKRARRDGCVQALQYQACVNAVGAVVMAVVLFAVRPDLGGGATSDWIAIVYLTAIPGVAAHVLNNWAQRYIDQSAASVILLGQPVLAGAGAAAFLDQPMGPLSLVGGLCVVAAAAVLVRRES
ncbi:MAG: hypothetical protein V7607_2637 [Solirubrobacteraceae bacterium]